LARFGADGSGLDFDASVETTLDALAQHLETHLDIEALLKLARPV
jgi:adenosylcobyric acid synthase